MIPFGVCAKQNKTNTQKDVNKKPSLLSLGSTSITFFHSKVQPHLSPGRINPRKWGMVGNCYTNAVYLFILNQMHMAPSPQVRQHFDEMMEWM